jgi:hypothetical protein
MTKSIQFKTVRLADSAVDGLIAGAGAGAAMAAFLVVMEWAMNAVSPGAVMARFDPGSQPVGLTGLFLHLAVSAVYGLVFGSIWRLIVQWLPVRWTGWLLFGLGGLYGSAIFLVAVLAFSRAGDQALFGFSPLIFWLAHVLYGGLLALFMGRMQRQVLLAAEG